MLLKTNPQQRRVVDDRWFAEQEPTELLVIEKEVSSSERREPMDNQEKVTGPYDVRVADAKRLDQLPLDRR